MKSLSMLRVELPAQNGKQETHAFAYSSLSSWVLRKNGDFVVLEIYFGKKLVKVTGRHLDMLIDALEEGRLKKIRTCPGEVDAHSPCIVLLEVPADSETR